MGRELHPGKGSPSREGNFKRVFPGVWKPLKIPFPGWDSLPRMGFPSQDGIPFPGRDSLPGMELPPHLLCLFFRLLYFSYLFLKTMICFSGCLMSSASIQKLFCGDFSVLKCSFDEFVREKVFSPSYSSAILGPPPNFLVLHSRLLTLLKNWD